MNHPDDIATNARSLRQVLLALADHEDRLAADEAATLLYWQPCPPTIVAHRAAADALRRRAARMADSDKAIA